MTALPLSVTIDGFRLGRGQNDRHGCWQARARRVKQERQRVATALWLACRERFALPGDPGPFRRRVGPGPWLCILTRCSPSPKGLDTDNLSGGLKAVRDELADWLGVDDGDGARVRWRYEQRRAPWGLEVRIEARP